MVTFPIDLPTSPGLIQSTFIPITNEKKTVSPLSRKQKVLSFDGDHWDLSFTLPLMSRVQAAPWQGKIASLRGSFGTFTWFDRYQTDILGTANSTAVVNGAAQVGSILNVSGVGASKTGVFLEGDKISFPVTGGNPELKIVLEDVDSNVSGQSAVPIWPPIINSPPHAGAINIGSANAAPVGVFRLVSPVPFPVTGIGNYEIAVAATEAL